MRILVTGGTGFIGTYVVKTLLSEGNTLLLLSRKPEASVSLREMPAVDFISGDLAHINIWGHEVERFKPQAAIHLAWESIPDYSARTSVRNLDYGLNLITLLAEVGCESFICTGSCWEYGEQSGKLSEDMIPKSANAFTAAKNAFHFLGREIAKENNMQFVWTRLFFVYGPGQRETSLIPHIINHVQKGEPPEIKAPSAKNDFVYVEDVARAICAIAKRPPKYGVYNIGSGSTASVQQIVRTIYDKLSLSDKYDPANKPVDNFPVDFWGDISKIKQDFGWEPEIGINEGIQNVINFILRK
ncbi:NAD-dependent epimerase/dehydratase family protein [Chloroflexota bacterium]